MANPTGKDELTQAVTTALGAVGSNVDVEQNDETGLYTVSAHLHEDLGSKTPLLQSVFGLGEFLNVRVAAALSYQLDFDYVLRFTVDTHGSVALDATTTSPMTITVKATLIGFSAEAGTLNNLLSAKVSIPPAQPPPNFNLTFAINPLDNGDAPFTLSGSANATLAMQLSFVSADAGINPPINPKLGATLHVAWSDTPSDLPGKFTDLTIDNVGLDVGALLPEFLTNIIGKIQTYTKRLQPIADFLQAEVPGLDKLGVHLSLEKLAELDGYPALGTFVTVVDLLNSLPSGGASDTPAMLQLGGALQFSGNAIDSILAGGRPSNLIGAVSAVPDSAKDLFSKADSMTEDSGISSGGFLSEAEGPDGEDTGGASDGDSDSDGDGGSVGFAFPIVTDPVDSVFQMLKGQDADLILFHASFSESLQGTVGAQFGPFSVFLTGGVALDLGLSLGYDTHGLRKFIANPADPSLLLDGLFFDTGTHVANGNTIANTGISVLGDIGVGAAALVVAVEGDLNGNAMLTLNNDLERGPHADADLTHHKLYIGGVIDAQPAERLFAVSGNVSISLNVEGGLFFGPVHAAVFTVQLAGDDLIDFTTALYPDDSGDTRSTDPHTIYIDLEDGDQNIHVYTTESVTRQLESDSDYLVHFYTTEYTLVVDYGDHEDLYPLGYIEDDTIAHTSTYFFDPMNPDDHTAPPPRYDLIAVRPSKAGSEDSGNHTITIEHSAIGGIVVNPDNETPVPDRNDGGPLTDRLNAVLVGGPGNDTFIYQASGRAVLVGNGGSNDLEGGVLEYGNYVDDRPTGGAVEISVPSDFRIPQAVMDELKESQSTNDENFNKYVSTGLPVPGVGSNNLVGTLLGDVLIGGPSGNTFQGDGGDDQEYGGAGFDTFVVSGTTHGNVRIYSSAEAYRPRYQLAYGIAADNRQAQYNQDELDVVSDPPPQSFEPPSPSNTNVVTIDPLGGSLPGDNIAFPDQIPVEVKTPDTTIDASGLAKVDLGGVDESTINLNTPQGPTYEVPYQITSLAIGNLSRTTLRTIEVSPTPNGPPCPIVFSGTGLGGDRFEEDSAAIPAETVTVPTVPNAPTTVPAHVTNAPTTIAGHESTTVELTPAGYLEFGPIASAPSGIHPVTLTVDNIRPQDSITLDGGGGGDTYIVNLDISTTFSTSIQDSSSKGLDTLDINGSGFVHPIPSRQNNEVNFNNGSYILPPPPPSNTVALPNQYGGPAGPVEGIEPVSAIAGQTSAAIVLAGGNLGFNPTSFDTRITNAPEFQDSVTYVSPNDVEFENDIRFSSMIAQQSTVHVGFNDDVKFLDINGGAGWEHVRRDGPVRPRDDHPRRPPRRRVQRRGRLSADRPVQAVKLVVSNAMRDMVLKGVGAAIKAGRNKAAVRHLAISTVDKNLGAAFNLGRNSAVLGMINANVRTALKHGGKSAILRSLSAGLAAYLQTVRVAPVFVSSPYDKLYLDGAQGKRYGSDVTNVSDFVGAQLTVNGYGYRDTVNLGTDGVSGASGTASLITGPVTVNNRGGLTTLNVDDSADTDVRDVQIRATSIAGLGPSYVTYSPTELAALNIVGTRGYIPTRFHGRVAYLPRYNTYDVLSTPGFNYSTELVQTTLTVLGAGGDTVSVLAASDKSLPDKGVDGTLQIKSPNHLTNLSIYGYVAPASAAGMGGRTARTLFTPSAGKSPTLAKAALNASVKLFASLRQAARTAATTSRVALKAQSVSQAKLNARNVTSSQLAVNSKPVAVGARTSRTTARASRRHRSTRRFIVPSSSTPTMSADSLPATSNMGPTSWTA